MTKFTTIRTISQKVGFYPTSAYIINGGTKMELVKTETKTEKRQYVLIDFLPEDFIKDSDFDINEEIILELDF